MRVPSLYVRLIIDVDHPLKSLVWCSKSSSTQFNARTRSNALQYYNLRYDRHMVSL